MNKYWVYEQIILVLSILLSVLIVVWRIKVAHSNSLALQKNNKIIELHLEIYKDIAGGIAEAYIKLSEINAKILLLPPFLSSASRTPNVFGRSQLSKYKGETLIKTHHDSNSSVIKIISIIEKYQITLRNFTAFKNAFAEMVNKLNEKFKLLIDEIADYLPYSVDTEKENNLLLPEKPNAETIEKINKLSDQYSKLFVELITYLMDLSIETQNSLLGSLFEHRIPPRQPEDPTIRVLSTD